MGHTVKQTWSMNSSKNKTRQYCKLPSWFVLERQFFFPVLPCPLQVRLSTGKDLRLSASMADTIGQLKKQLQAQEDIDATHQRWFFSGKLLTDKTRLQDTKIQKDFVIQVIINPQALRAPKPSPTSAE